MQGGGTAPVTKDEGGQIRHLLLRPDGHVGHLSRRLVAVPVGGIRGRLLRLGCLLRGGHRLRLLRDDSRTRHLAWLTDGGRRHELLKRGRRHPAGTYWGLCCQRGCERCGTHWLVPEATVPIFRKRYAPGDRHVEEARLARRDAPSAPEDPRAAQRVPVEVLLHRDRRRVRGLRRLDPNGWAERLPRPADWERSGEAPLPPGWASAVTRLDPESVAAIEALQERPTAADRAPRVLRPRDERAAWRAFLRGGGGDIPLWETTRLPPRPWDTRPAAEAEGRKRGEWG